MFLVNSRYPLFCATRSLGSLLFLSYKSILPSSFNIILSSALIFSIHPPVSVSGTVYTFGFFLELYLTIIPSIQYNDHLKFVAQTGYGILTVFPSTLTIVSALGTDLLYVDYHCVETLGFSACMSFTRISVTHVSILTSLHSI